MAAELIRKCKFLHELNSDQAINSKTDLLSKSEQDDNEIKGQHKQQTQQEEEQQQQTNGNKRIRCETPPTTDSEDAEDDDKLAKDAEGNKPKKSKLLPSLSSPLSATQYHQTFLTTIQMKILQLQNDLSELNDSEEDNDDDRVNINLKITAQEAEAIGFATCAQETLLFLQNEGISNESELYKKLRETLTGEK